MKKLKIVELFSGIGSQARALKNVGIDIDVLATCEWDIHAFVAYDAMHNGSQIIDCVSRMTKEEVLNELKSYTLSNNGKEPMTKISLRGYTVEALKRILTAIKRTNNLVDVSEIRGSQMPNKVDLLTYSFPCQDLSNVGAFHGYKKGIDKNSGSRSSLLWQVGRILNEMQLCHKDLPKYLVMENVPTLLSNRHINNFNQWIEELEKLGYVSKYIPVNARNYGIPQNRPRLLMLSILVGDNHALKKEINSFFEKWGNDEKYIVSQYHQSNYYNELSIADLIRIPSDKESPLWLEALECTPNDTPSRRKIWRENPVIVNSQGNITKDTFIRTITTKQDRHPNSGNIYFDTKIEGRGKFRYLTPRECLLFMGFTDQDYEKLKENNIMQRKNSCLFPRDKIIRMAGNSIPVKMLEGFFYQLYDLEKILNKSN